MAQIIMDHVEKAYAGGVKAINDLSLDIADGEFMVFVGPSGCGKSTALRSIAGLEEITAGSITIGDRVVNDLPPKDRDIAMVFQNYALYPHMTVEQNLAFGLQLRKTPKQEIKRRVGEAARMLGLEPYLKRKPAALSGGQRQRVAMGRAIVREPQAFLMDEPLEQPGRQAAGVHAGLAEPAARPARRHHRLRDPRPGRGHDAGQPGGRAAGRAAAAGRHAAGPVRGAGQPVRGRVHRLPRDELRYRDLVRDDGPAVTFAGYQLPVPAAVLENKPGLADYFGKDVILGIRPSDFEDAAVADRQWGTMQVTAGVTEELGSEINVIFTIDAPHVEHASIAEATEASEDRGGRRPGRRQVAVDGAGLQGEPGQARGVARAGRRHALPAVLRPGQRPVHRPPEGHGGAGGLTRRRRHSLGSCGLGAIPAARPQHCADRGKL